jgi:sialate O-acetylesterase
VKEKRMYECKWSVSAPETSPRMSAVGYYFGQHLQKQLGVPVGIIHASLGGSNMLAWIPRDVVKKEYPGCQGGDWVKSKYASAWVRGRAQQNVGPGGDFSLHPYAPSYLYETGLERWEGFPVAGAIWYQGESDAEILDNEQNKKLLKDLISSWRDKLGKDDLPFLQVQLPRINDKAKLRAYWPEFRQVQSEVAEEMPGVECVVTMDLGSTNSDVHPPRKVEVGERLAATALKEVYGKDVPASGPVVKSFKAKGDKVQVKFENAEGLKTTNGAAPVGFELAGADKNFVPATAEIRGESVILTADGVKAPKFMRYGWAVFMEPNLVNEAGLPAAPCPATDGKIAKMDSKKKDKKKRK